MTDKDNLYAQLIAAKIVYADACYAEHKAWDNVSEGIDERLVDGIDAAQYENAIAYIKFMQEIAADATTEKSEAYRALNEAYRAWNKACDDLVELEVQDDTRRDLGL